jgi:PAS domain S-box-containing protein
MPPRTPDSSEPRLDAAELARENEELREALGASRHAQERLRDTEQRLRAVVDHAPVVVFATDHSGVFTLSEGKGLLALGLQPGQVVGMSAFEVYRDFPQISANLRECLAGAMVNDVVHVGDRIFESLYVPRRNASGEVVGVSGVAWDVTARTRAEETAVELEAQLRQAQKMEMVGTLAGGIAHDFNNILSPILGYSDLALAELPEGHPARDDVEQVMKAARRARDLVKQILIFSRRSDHVKHPVQLHLVVNEALKLIRSMFPSNIEISQHVENEGDTIMADTGQMHQVMMNLAMNAAHAMREKGGVLRVELMRREIDEATAKSVEGLRPGPHVVLSVIDEGEGMDEATRGRVFEPFFTTKRPGEGTGLGLSVVHGIVHSHGGGIEVKSRPKVGSTFRAYFPVTTLTDTRPGEPVGAEGGRGGEHILIVDDEPAIVTLLQRMLELRGYRVTAFSSSEEALAGFRRTPDAFDAIITDQTMPKMSGLELASAVHIARPNIPIVLTTGYVDRTALRDIGRDIAGVSSKPFDAASITRILRHALDRTG